MSKRSKRLAEFTNLRMLHNYHYSKLVTVLRYYGYSAEPGGLTSGSRMTFSKSDGQGGRLKVYLHRPHRSGDTMSPAAVKDVYDQLERNGDIKKDRVR
jgi:hypothetical protein